MGESHGLGLYHDRALAILWLMAEFQDVEHAKILIDKIKTKHKIMNNIVELSAMI